MLKNILIVACIGTFVNEVQAAPVAWTGGTSDLALGSNWAGGIVPTAVGSSGEFGGLGLSPTLSSVLTLGSIDFTVGNLTSYIFQLQPGSALSFAGDPGVTNSSPILQNFFIGQAGSPGATLTFPANADSMGPINYTFTGMVGSPSQLIFEGNSPGSQNIVTLNDYSLMQVGAGFDVKIGSLSGTPFSSVIVGATSSLTIGDLNLSSTTTYSGSMKIDPSATVIVGPLNNLTLAGYLSGGKLSVNGTVNFIGAGAGPLAGLIVGGEVNMNDQTLTTAGLDGSGVINLGVAPTTNLVVTGPGTFFGSLTGAGGLALVTPTPEDFFLAGPNNYTGPTTLLAGTLVLTNTGSLNPKTVLLFNPNELGATFNLSAASQTISGLASSETNSSLIDLFSNQLTIQQNLNSNYFGAIEAQATGTMTKTGKGLLNLAGNSPNFSGILQLNSGGVAVNGTFGDGSAHANVNGGILSGTGKVAGSVLVVNDAAIKPGNSVGTLSITGNLELLAGSSFLVEVDVSVGSSLLNVGQTTTLEGAVVQVIPTGAGLGLNQVYPILNSGTLIGTFDGVSFVGINPALVRPILTYGGNSVFLEAMTNFGLVAGSANEKAVATVLDSFVPTSALARKFLGALVTLPTEQVQDVLDELSGNQHTVDLFATSVLSRNFLRRLYDPIRDMVTTLPCNQYEMPLYSGIDTWAEGSFDRQTLRNDGNGFGFTLSGWELTFGFQSHMNQDWILGFAGSYVEDTLQYNLGGHGDMTGGFAGFYALYRPEYFYALGNLAFGHTQNHLFRKASAGGVVFDADSRPELTEWSAYAEAGVDLPICDILIQPFVGIEGFTSSRNSLVEDGASSFNLLVSKKDRASAASRLGLHVTTMEWFSDFSFSLDVAWEYQLTTTQNDLRLAFNDFGPEFTTQGIRVPRNSADGALTIQYFAEETVQFYGQFAGEVWNNSTNYSVLGGLQLRW